ncbi:MAG: peptidase S41, partial [Polyangiales bacterium]
MKLTTAHYLTPGDVSIQGVGITPDIAIDPMTVDHDDMDLAVDQEYLRESDLRSHLTHDRARVSVKPRTVLRYYLPREVRARLREARPEELEENEKEAEFLTRFSQKLLSKVSSSARPRMLSQAKDVVAAVAAEEMAKAKAELQRLGIDWGAGDDKAATDLDVKVHTSAKDNRVQAGAPFSLDVEVHNRGRHPVYQLRATTESDFGLFNGRELVFGRIDPGQTRRWSTTLGVCRDGDDVAKKRTKKKEARCLLPKDLPDRADGIRIKFSEAHDRVPPVSEIRTQIDALPRPQFAYALQVADDLKGNGDGAVQRGEQVSVYLRVRNLGPGVAEEAQANLRNLSGRGVLLKDGRFSLNAMQRGDERLVRFTFEVLPDFARQEAKLEVTLSDATLRESVTEKIRVPLAERAAVPKAHKTSVVLKAGTPLLEGPRPTADTIAKADGAIKLRAFAKLGGFLRLDVGKGQPAWAAASAVQSGGKARGRLRFVLNHMPPQLEVDHGDQLVTRGSHLRLQGKAEDDQRVRDLYIFVGARKVFYQANREQTRHKATFRTEVPLQKGINYITVFARESSDIVSR